MEYIYAALLLHKLRKPVSEENVKKVIQAAGAQADDIRAKALVSALSEINIDEALKSAVFTQAPAGAAAAAAGVAPAAEAAGARKTEVKEEDEKKKEEEALAGLSSLFG